MTIGSRFIKLGVFLCLSLAIFAVLGACGAPAAEVREVEVIKEVPVEKEVVKEVVKEVPVEVIKEVPKEVIVTQEVVKEVEKEVVVTKEVEVVKEVPVEVIKEVMVEPEAGPKDTIVFSDLNWTSAQVQNRIAQYIVEHGYGYPTDLVFGGTLPLFQGLRAGDSHVTMEIWLPNQIDAWEEALADGEVVPIGASLGNDWQSTFVIPAYMQEQYPDLDHVDDLKDPKFQEIFATTDSRGKARLVACVPGWSCELVNDAQIEGYDLTDYLHVIKPGSQDAMFAEVIGAYEKEEPWLGYMWGTGDPALLLDLVRLEETPYSDECWYTTKACAFEDASILIAVHPTIPVRAPEVVEFLRMWDFNINLYKSVAQWMQENPDATTEEAAINWMENNEGSWSGWVTDEASAGVKAALAEGKEAEGWPDA